MFSKDEKLKGKDIETIIGPSVKVKGEFNGQGDIIIDGYFEGVLKTAGSLFVGNKAKVQANIEARDGKISGEITGNIKMKGFMEITATARINGDIDVNQISIEQGAVINGNLLMKKHEGITAADSEK